VSAAAAGDQRLAATASSRATLNNCAAVHSHARTETAADPCAGHRQHAYWQASAGSVSCYCSAGLLAATISIPSNVSRRSCCRHAASSCSRQSPLHRLARRLPPLLPTHTRAMKCHWQLAVLRGGCKSQVQRLPPLWTGWCVSSSGAQPKPSDHHAAGSHKSSRSPPVVTWCAQTSVAVSLRVLPHAPNYASRNVCGGPSLYVVLLAQIMDYAVLQLSFTGLESTHVLIQYNQLILLFSAAG
jgi:hypothetical protein